MDFRVFILFTVVALLGFGAVVSATLHQAGRRRLLIRLGVIAAFLLLWGLYIYKAYFLDDGLAAAATNGDIAAVKSLLARGASPNARSEGGWPAIICSQDNAAIVKLLLEHGADINVRDEQGNTALKRAKNLGYKDVVELLTKAGARE